MAGKCNAINGATDSRYIAFTEVSGPNDNVTSNGEPA